MTSLSIQSTVTLNDGVAMPLLGFGTYQIASGAGCLRALTHALKCSYRHIDTAALYGNEADVGRAVRESGLARSEVFVTTKLWNSDHGYDSTLKAFERSRSRLQLDSIDLYLIHWPEPGKRLDSWRAMAEIKSQGRCRSIGVSNYTVKHLEELLRESDIVPSVNQVEFSPFLFQRDLLRFCAAKSIQLVAYCPLTRGDKLKHPVVTAVARKHAKTSAQVLLRWALQHGIAVIPKSSRPERISENAGVFDFALDAEDLARLDRLDEGYRTCWDPRRVP
jgi:diketogulonate reductase-like aldo/keto reductase